MDAPEIQQVRLDPGAATQLGDSLEAADAAWDALTPEQQAAQRATWRERGDQARARVQYARPKQLVTA